MLLVQWANTSHGLKLNVFTKLVALDADTGGKKKEKGNSYIAHKESEKNALAELTPTSQKWKIPNFYLLSSFYGLLIKLTH